MSAISGVDQRYVAHLDMLGMSELTVRDPELAWEALASLSKAKEEILNLQIKLLATGEVIRDRVRAFIFSDTILIFSLSDEAADIWAMLILVTELFCRALHYCIPLRGGIAHGRFLFNLDHNLFAGPPLVAAYHLSEQAQWLGIRVDDVIAQRAGGIPLRSRGRPIIIDWTVPLTSGEGGVSHVIDWVETHRCNFTVNAPITVGQFFEAFSQRFGPLAALPPQVRRKYENTVAFVNERLRA